jgi:hypothetical protein
MELTLSFAEINWLSVLVAALLAFGIGGLWYSPVLFSKVWQKELKLSDEEIKNASMPLVFGTSFVLNFIAAVMLDLFIGKESTLLSGIQAGLLVSIAWIATALGINYLFARKSLKLFLIDAGYFVTFFVVMGAVLGAW